MVDVARLQIRVDSDETRKANTALKGLESQSKRNTQTNNRFEASNKKVSSSFVSLRKAAIGFFSVYAGARAIRSLGRTTDSFTVIQNKLKLVTNGTEELAQVQNQLIRVADKTFTSLSSNATLFNRLTISTRELGVSTQDVIDATQAVQQTFRISGATAQEAANSAIQFAQGLAAGALRGDEFRSVSENNIRLQQLLAEGLGVTTGKLKEMADNGELTSKTIFPVLVRAMEKLNKEAENIAPTFEQAFAKIREKFAQGVDEALRAESQFTALGEAIVDLSEFSKALGTTLGQTLGVLSNFSQAAKKTATDIKALLTIDRANGQSSIGDPAAALVNPQSDRLQRFTNISLGGLINPPTPKSKPEAPNEFFLRQLKKEQALKKESDELEKQRLDKIKSVNEELVFNNEQLTRSNSEQEVYNNLRQAGVSIDSQAGKEIALLTRRFSENKRAMDAVESVSNSLQNAFINFATGAGDARSALRGLVIELQRFLLIQATGGSSGGGAGGLLSQVVGSAFSFFGGGGGSLGSRSLAAAGGPGSIGVKPFASGGSFGVGGFGGTDSQLVQFKASPDETVHVTRGNQGLPGSGGQTVFNIDARGAEPGVEDRIMRVLKSVDRSIEERALNAVQNKTQRDPRFNRR